MTHRRRGFALLAVLWVMVSLGALLSGSVRGARTAVAASGNRIALERGRWAAESCLAIAMAGLDSLAALRLFEVPPSDSLQLGNLTSCRTVAHEPEARVHRDSATAETLRRLDSVIAQEPRLAVDSFLTDVGSGRVNLNSASVEVLAVLPGMNLTGARTIASARHFRRRLSSISDVTALLGSAERDSLMSRYAEFERAVTFSTSSLILIAAGRDSRAPPVFTVEVLIAPVGSRVGVLRRRSW